MQNENQKKVLYVDDDRLLLDMYKIKFSNEGYDIKVAESGEAGLKILREGFKPDVFLVDILMSEMDGHDFVLAIKRENLVPPTSIIVMLTNQTLTDDVNRAREQDVDGYIIKAMTIPSQVVKEVEKIYNSKNKK